MKLKEIIDIILTEEEQGYLGVIDGYRISVEGKEEPIPHIHCVKGDPKHPISVSCIFLVKNGYANHSSWQTELPKKVFDKITDFLGNGKANKTGVNIWIKTVEDWNESNNFKIPKKTVNTYNSEIVYN